MVSKCTGEVCNPEVVSFLANIKIPRGIDIFMGLSRPEENISSVGVMILQSVGAACGGNAP